MEKAKVAPRGLYKRVGQLHQHNVLEWSMHLVNGTFTFPSINASWVLQSHEDALVLTLGISGFDLKRVLVDLDNSADLLQMLAYK